jgi:DNA helicase-2/ATP-dependent DNA helicase PcrA
VKYLDDLNERQKEAVLATEGPVSVLAGAGSGKTKVLTTRIYHLIREGVPPEKILAVTFTNKAAREMRERLGAKLGTSIAVWKTGPQPFVATFHGLGRELLERYGRPLNIPRHFTIFDRDDSVRAVKEALKERGIDPKEIEPRSVLNRISRAKNDGDTAQSFSERHTRDFRSRVVGDVWKKYDATLLREKALDFDDLLTLPVKLLREYPEVRKMVQDRFEFIHIDEFQDTNEVQGQLASLLAGEKKNLFVVGDIDQTIYTWRGATIDNLLEFEKTYPNAKTIVLEHNYRSTKTIVDAANQIIERNRNRKEKRSVTHNPPGDAITLQVAATAEAEAAWIARECMRLARRENIPFTDMAVLFRTNFQSRALEEAFLAENIPYRLLGTKYYDRKEVKDVLAWVRLALDPSREADRVRAVQFPSRGIGKVLLGKITAGKHEEMKPSEKAKVEAFERIVEKLGEVANTLPPSEFVRFVLTESGIEKALDEGTEEDRERLGNAAELATLASRHDEMPGRDGISAFLADAALAGDQDEMDRPETDKKEGVTLMTVHAAKGLEFDTVFVSGLEAGLFPHDGQEGDEDRDEEEERRLFYVAVTRARKRLYLTLAHIRRIYGTDYINEPSEFIRDIDPSLVRYPGSDDPGEDVIEA